VFNGKALARVAGRFARRLHHTAPTTAFAVVAVPDEVGRAGTVGGCFPRWRLGTVQVRGRRSATSAESTATHVYGMAKAGAGSAGTSAAEPVHARGGGAAAAGGVGDGALGTLPPEALFGLAVTLPLPDLLQCLPRVLAHGYGQGEPVSSATQLGLVAALLAGVVVYITDGVVDAVQVGVIEVSFLLACLLLVAAVTDNWY
jgi:hypothetical protein